MFQFIIAFTAYLLLLKLSSHLQNKYYHIVHHNTSEKYYLLDGDNYYGVII